MSRQSAFLTALLAWCGLAAFSACSLDRGVSPGAISVRLAPQPVTHNLMESLSALGLSAVTTPTALSDFQCFAVNAVAPGVTGETTCRVPVGAVDGSYSSIDARFNLLVPIVSGLSLEAYAYKSTGGCGGFPGATEDALYKIGSISNFDATNSTNAVIPVGTGGMTLAGACGTFQTFFDNFNAYSATTLTGQGGWVTGGANTSLDASGTLVTGSTPTTYQNVHAGALDPTRSYTKISADVAHTNSPAVYLQAVVSVTSGFSCLLDFTAVSPLSIQQIGFGSVSSAAFTEAASGTLTCEITNISADSVTMTASYPDSGGTIRSVSSTFSNGSPVSPTDVSIKAVVGATQAIFLDNLKVVQSF